MVFGTGPYSGAISVRRVRARAMKAVVAALAMKPPLLTRALNHFVFRKAIGVEAHIKALRALGATIGDEVLIGARVAVRVPANLTIGDGTNLSGKVWIDSWEPVVFGKDVMVNDDLAFLTAEHDLDSPTFEATVAGLRIGDHAWLPQKIIVLPGADIGMCAVVGSGSVVTKPVEPYAVVAGNPARKIGERARREYTYRPSAMSRCTPADPKRRRSAQGDGPGSGGGDQPGGRCRSASGSPPGPAPAARSTPPAYPPRVESGGTPRTERAIPP